MMSGRQDSRAMMVVGTCEGGCVAIGGISGFVEGDTSDIRDGGCYIDGTTAINVDG